MEDACRSQAGRLLLVQHLLLLFLQVPGDRLEHAFEHRFEGLVHAVAEDAVLFGFLLRRLDQFGELEVLRGVARLVPFADGDEMFLQPPDRVAERPGIGLARRTIGGGIVRRRMAFGAISEMLDQRRTLVGPRALGGPFRGGIDRQRVIAVDAQAGNAIADRARGEGGRLGPGETGEARDRPLVVDDVEDDRRLVDRREGQR
ncbi:hypothetical protein QU38_02845, partial [Staphylococcus aureus]